MGVSIPRGDGSTLRCYRQGDTGPGVVLLHAWWGLNQDVIGFADELAGQGFQVIAPDLFDGSIATTVEDANNLVETADNPRGLADVNRVLDHLRNEGVGKIGLVGLSFGAAYALSTAAEGKGDALVLFYGTGLLEPEDRLASPVLGHFAEDDPYEEDGGEALFEQIRALNIPHQRHQYPGTYHWFVEPSNSHYDREAAELAWGRTHDFLRRHLQA